MKRIYEAFLIPRNFCRFKSIKSMNKYAKKFRYQLIDFYWTDEKVKDHIPLSVTFHPLTFQEEFSKRLNRKKIIIINGQWQDVKYYYHFLRFNKYKAYLLR